MKENYKIIKTSNLKKIRYTKKEENNYFIRKKLNIKKNRKIKIIKKFQ